MKKKLQILSFFVTLSFLSCCSADKCTIDSNPILDEDFPISENLKFKTYNKYDISNQGLFMVDGSILWYFQNLEKNDDLGYCYDLKTGAKLSTVALKGDAPHEILRANYHATEMIGDSVQLHSEYSTMDNLCRTIKTFAKKDIIENKPMNERKFSVVTAPDSINATQMIKLANGSVVATLSLTNHDSPIQKKCNLNNKSVAIFNENEAKAYETIDYDSFDLKEANSIKPEEIIKNTYAYGDIKIKDNDMIVFSVRNQFILYTFEPNSGNVVKEKRYTTIKGTGKGSYISTNDLKMEISYMRSTDKYIFCAVRGYFSKKDMASELRTWKIFVFDWDLNPIKRFDLPNEKIDEYIISNDCKSVYLGKYTDGGLTLSKADLDI